MPARDNHRLISDLAIAAALGAIGVVELVREVEYEGLPVFPGSTLVNAIVIAVIVAGIALRRTLPWPAFAIVTSAIVAQSLIVGGSEAAFLFLAVIIATYSVTAATGAWLPITLIVGAVMAVHAARNPTFETIGDAAFSAGLAAVAIGLGMAVRRRASRIRHLEARASSLLDEREALTRQAVETERDRIARELHDIIAHSLGVIVVQAEGGIAALADREPAASEAFERISTTGRDALAEMRSMLGVLRDDPAAAPDAPAPRAPQPSLARLDELIAQASDTGLRVQLATHGLDRTLPPGLDATAYRIVQEALSNARKHAPSAARVDVHVHRGDGTLEIRVHNDLAGTSAASDAPIPGAGRGLAGMRERVEHFGGTLTAGRTSDGRRHQLIAHLPVPEGAR